MTTAVITGAGSGLGQKIAILNSTRYDNLVLIGRNSKKLNTTAEKCIVKGENRVFCLACDLTNEEQIHQTGAWIDSHLGTVDLLVNNAGLGYFENLLSQSFEQIERTFATDLTGMIKFTRLMLPLMVDHVGEAADIVNIASIAGKIATAKTTTYASAKFGVIGFSNALRLEMYDRNIRVHTINPGPMDTNFFSIADPSGKYLKGVQQFVINANQVAELVNKAIIENLREVNVPKIMGVGAIMYTLFPKMGDLIVNSPLINRK
ncbi:SDR family NAD(P)-dependent oxidoreductase [Pediococcus pentosaceus]|uniref:SDR family NAD(P)-dependent oxidoreductase n=1 Tax=Pediococcus pentosaceus TaxID=1255 RepID=UPI00223BA250|nr:SDR family NAD(P)-dependent oxidoreductase [Pediococcus pentosaceus]MCS8572872.1 SDR family NAD(P)-dependent oxidoreductase [Pediococcus pentosaceus]